jgi:hypothetical protein
MKKLNICARVSLPAFALAIALAMTPTHAAADDKGAVEKVMRETWDKPDARLDVGPVVVSADHAIAGWTQGDMGGRALLHRRAGQWAVILCAGDALLSSAALQQIGLPAATASSLATNVRSAEADIAADRVAKFNAFQGMVQMDNHGPAKH